MIILYLYCIYDIRSFFDAKIRDKKYRTLCGHMDDQKSDIVRPEYRGGWVGVPRPRPNNELFLGLF